MSIRRSSLLLIVAFVLIAEMVAAQELTLAAAADLQSAMQEISSRFQQKTSHPIKVIYGSSGNFAQQIKNGAPFDMFFSANLDYPKQLEASGLTEPDTFYQYAKGKIVIWVPNDSRIDVQSGMQSLLAPSVRKIAIANPQHAPYGKAAVSAMQTEGVYDKVKDKLVLGENISQTASFVVSGSADVGIVALVAGLVAQYERQGPLHGDTEYGLSADRTGLRHLAVVEKHGRCQGIFGVCENRRHQRIVANLRLRSFG